MRCKFWINYIRYMHSFNTVSILSLIWNKFFLLTIMVWDSIKISSLYDFRIIEYRSSYWDSPGCCLYRSITSITQRILSLFFDVEKSFEVTNRKMSDKTSFMCYYCCKQNIYVYESKTRNLRLLWYGRVFLDLGRIKNVYLSKMEHKININ